MRRKGQNHGMGWWDGADGKKIKQKCKKLLLRNFRKAESTANIEKDKEKAGGKGLHRKGKKKFKSIYIRRQPENHVQKSQHQCQALS